MSNGLVAEAALLLIITVGGKEMAPAYCYYHMTLIMKATQFWEDNVMYLLFPAANWQRDHVNHQPSMPLHGLRQCFPGSV